MIIRQSLNFAAHLAAGAAFGALAFVAWQLWQQRTGTPEDQPVYDTTASSSGDGSIPSHDN